MSKRILQDIKKTYKPISQANYPRMRRGESRDENNIKTVYSKQRVSHIHAGKGGNNGSNFSRFAIWSVAFVSIIFFLFIFLSVFSGAVIEITPLQKSVTVNSEFSAVKVGTNGALNFKLMAIDGTVSTEVPATEERQVKRKASGDIIIYNAYSSKSQKLIKRTRFETPDGKVYRINKSVIVPGTVVKKGEIIPGRVEVTVYADIPGEEYNIGLTDFTIPGFKGDPRFEKFYARSKTPIDGGFSGVIKSVSSEELRSKRKELQNSLKETMLSQARPQIPENFVLYDNAVFFVFNKKEGLVETTGSSVNITEDGKLYAVLFNKSELSKQLAEKTIESYNKSDVMASGLEDLKFNIINREEFDPEKSSKLSFTISGSTNIVWEVDEQALIYDLIGIDKQNFIQVIKKYTNIQKAQATIRPFWKKQFPKKVEDITIKKVL
jgi:hypothetical protein